MPDLKSNYTLRRFAQPAYNLPTEIRLTGKLGLPLALGEIGWMSTYIVDALMIGRLPHSALSIAASSLGNTIFYAISFCCIASLTGLETLVAQAFGRGDQEECSRILFQALWFLIVQTPLVMFGTLAVIPLLPIFGTPPEIVRETSQYLHALVWSAAPLLAYWALRRYLQSVGQVMLIMISLVSAGLVNFAGDWAFLYGHLGLRPYGVAGSGWATCIVRLYTVSLLLIALALQAKRGDARFSLAWLRPDWTRLRLLFRIGWSAGIESLADLGVSTFMSIVCARLGAVLLAAHQVVLDLDAFIYMAPLGLSYATITRVGQSAGRNSIPQVRRATQASLLLGVGFISIAASLFAGFGHFWAGLYTTDTAAIEAAAPIFVICGVLQFGDAIGIVIAAALVGVGDTRTPLIVNLIWSWLIGMPIGYFLAFSAGFGLKGLWFGRALAAIGSSVTLAFLWKLWLGGGIKLYTSTLDALQRPYPLRQRFIEEKV